MKAIIFLITLLTIFNTQDVGIKITLLDSPLQVWCGNSEDNDKNVLVLTSKGSVYKSSDKGDTWEKLSDSFQKSAVQTGVVNRITKSPVEPNLVIFLGSEGVHWISEDCGNTIRSLGKGEFQYHPTEKNWLLASSWTNCYQKGQQTQQPCHITKELYVSKDLGKNWDFLVNYVVQFAWGIKSNINNNFIPKERIIWSQELNGKFLLENFFLAKGHQRISGWNQKTHLFYSDDFFKNKKMIVSQGNKFLLTSTYLFVAQVQNAEDQHVNLLVANPNSVEYEFVYANVNQELKQHSFTILDTSEGQVFLNINHYKPNAPMGNIYKSDSTGTSFALSLKDNVRDPSDGQCDFEKVIGMDGVYISNVYEGKRAQRYKSLISSTGDSEDIQFEKKGKKKQNQVGGDDVKDLTETIGEFKKTKISFDKGGIWKQLTPPMRDAKGNKQVCDLSSGCSLHLHSVSSKMNFGPFYSTENSVGIVMGTGNVGQYLANRPDQVNTYLSRDSGLNWYEVKKGSNIYEFGDHGGLIILASDQKATNSISYTWDEGLTFNNLEFWDKQVEVTNIITEPSNTALRFIVYGETLVKSNLNELQQGVVITFDFQQSKIPPCVGADSPDTDDSDYETWRPNGKISPNCLLGKKVTYARRKRDAQCFNGQQFDRKISVEQCECTEEDWECDIGFSRKGDGPCERIDGLELEYAPPETCGGEGYYEVTQGYRKVAGDICKSGIDHKPLRLPCPMFGFLSTSNFYNFMVLMGALGCIYILYQNVDQLQLLLLKFLDLFSDVTQMIKIEKRKPQGNSEYIDFSKMNFEQNDNQQFDNELIDEEKGESKNDNQDENQEEEEQQEVEVVQKNDEDLLENM